MTRRILVVPAHEHVGLTAVCLGLTQALSERRVDVGYAKPLAQPGPPGYVDQSVDLFRLATTQRPPSPVSAERMQELLALGQLDELLGEVLLACGETFEEHELTILEGLAPSASTVLSEHVNEQIARGLDADVIVAGSAVGTTPEATAEAIAAAAATYAEQDRRRVVGVVVNRVAVGPDALGTIGEYEAALRARGLPVAAVIAEDDALAWPRVRDLSRQLGLEVLHPGDEARRIGGVIIAAQSIPGCLSSLAPDRLVLVPGDRHDILLAAALTEMTGVRLAAVLLTAGIRPDPEVLDLCRPALEAGLPLLLSPEKTLETATRVIRMDPEIPADDEDRALRVMRHMGASFDEDWLRELPAQDRPHRVSPTEFKLRTLRALGRNRYTIALSDGASPSVVAAALYQHELGVLRCILVARPDDVVAVARDLDVTLPPDLAIVDPEREDERLAAHLMSLRPGSTLEEAQAALTDPQVRSLLMLALGDVDAVVGGELSQGCRLLDLGLEIIGQRPDVQTICSGFAMLLPDGVVAYADCSLNPEPTSRDLACIAAQTANTIDRSQIPPRVAFVGPSRTTPHVREVEARVAEAVEFLRLRRPDLPVDGPLPFEVAASASKAAIFAPDSPVAGHATVFVFPDLRTANATYKAVRRSSGASVIGPILQGFRKPFNALPRDARPQEVVDQIIATALQASQLV